jgi:hypothetical protein
VSLLTIAAVVVAYLCFVAFVMALLAAAKRGDKELERAHRALGRRRRRWDDRHVVEEEDRSEEIVTISRRGG